MGGTLASLAFMFYVHSRQGPLGIWDLIFPITAVLAYFWPFGLLMSAKDLLQWFWHARRLEKLQTRMFPGPTDSPH